MRTTLTILLISLFLFVQGQRNIIGTFNNLGVYGPGLLISEEIHFYSDHTFKYFSFGHTNYIINASGKYTQNKSLIVLEFQMVTLDTFKTNGVTIDSTNIKLCSEFKIVKDKKWAGDESETLILCNGSMSHIREFLIYGKGNKIKRKLFLKRKTRLIKI